MACTCKVCSNPHCRRGNPLVPPSSNDTSTAKPGFRRKTDARRYSELLAITLGVCLALGSLSIYVRARLAVSSHSQAEPAATATPIVLQPDYPVKVFFNKTTGKCTRLVYAGQEYACSEPIPGVLEYLPE